MISSWQHKPRIPVGLNWLASRHLERILRIDSQQPGGAWPRQELLAAMRDRSCCGRVAEHRGETYGYVLYELGLDCVRGLRLAVDAPYRRRGIGTALLGFLKNRLGPHRTRLRLDVREDNLDAQLFLRSAGLRWVATVPGKDIDWYVMMCHKRETT